MASGPSSRVASTLSAPKWLHNPMNWLTEAPDWVAVAAVIASVASVAVWRGQTSVAWEVEKVGDKGGRHRLVNRGGGTGLLFAPGRF